MPALYAGTIVFIIVPVIDVITNVWPLDPGNIQWRYGLFGIASNYLVAPMFGLLLLALIAAAADHRGMLMAALVLSALGGILLLLGSALYGLDILQLRNAVRPEAEFAFNVGGAKSMFKMVASAIALLMLAVGAYRAWRLQSPRVSR